MTTEAPTQAPANGQTAPAAELSIVAPRPADARVVVDTGPLAHLFDTARFEQTQRIAKVMATSSLLPKHLWGVEEKYNLAEATANCFRVCNQAIRWGFDPFAVVDETYMVAGRLGYQGKLVAAVVNVRCGIVGGLRYLFSGKKGNDDFACVCYASANPITPEARELLLKYCREDDATVLNDLDALDVRAVRVSYGQAKTFGKDGRSVKEAWTKDPEQKLTYNAATKWARRHAPEVVLGVLTDDDLDRMRADLTLSHAAQAAAPALPAPSVAEVVRRFTPPDDATLQRLAESSKPIEQPEATGEPTQPERKPDQAADEQSQAKDPAPVVPADFAVFLAGTWKKDQLSPILREFFPLGNAPPAAMSAIAAAEDRIEGLGADLTTQLDSELDRVLRCKTISGVVKSINDARAASGPEAWKDSQLALILAVCERRKMEIGR